MKIPEGVIAVKPMPKPGWQLATAKGKYARAYDYYGTPLTEGVTEIAWTGGELPDDWYDEFVFRGSLADRPYRRGHASTSRWCRSAPTAQPTAGSRSPPPARTPRRSSCRRPP